MSLVRIKHIATTSIHLRVPTQVKSELNALRKLADKHEVNFTATMAERLEEVLKAVRSEIEALDRKASGHANGVGKEA